MRICTLTKRTEDCVRKRGRFVRNIFGPLQGFERIAEGVSGSITNYNNYTKNSVLQTTTYKMGNRRRRKPLTRWHDNVQQDAVNLLGKINWQAATKHRNSGDRDRKRSNCEAERIVS